MNMFCSWFIYFVLIFALQYGFLFHVKKIVWWNCAIHANGSIALTRLGPFFVVLKGSQKLPFPGSDCRLTERKTNWKSSLLEEGKMGGWIEIFGGGGREIPLSKVM